MTSEKMGSDLRYRFSNWLSTCFASAVDANSVSSRRLAIAAKRIGCQFGEQKTGGANLRLPLLNGNENDNSLQKAVDYFANIRVHDVTSALS